jgi:serine/threonine protein kinase
MYELICGHTPFGHHKSETEKLRAIVQGHYHLPSYVSEHARSLISKLLTTNPAKRLGNLKRKEKDIILHPWFEGFDWEAHAAHKMPVGSPLSRTVLCFSISEAGPPRSLIRCLSRSASRGRRRTSRCCAATRT